MIRFMASVRRDPGAEVNYLRALVETGIPVRVVPFNFADYTMGLGDWSEFETELTRPMEDEFINVVCGGSDSLVKSFRTLGALANVAIVFKQIDGELLRQYDLVICEDRALADYYRAIQINVVWVGPDPMVLGMIMKELKDNERPTAVATR
jgi:hypothetical protein